MLLIIRLIIAALIFEAAANAERLTLCTQNLNNYGYKDKSGRGAASQAEFRDKQFALLERFSSADCDLIAVQEILAARSGEAQKLLESLADALETAQKRKYKILVSESNDPFLRMGMLFDQEKFLLLDSKSHSKTLLAPLAPGQRPRLFTRGPLEVLLRNKSTTQDFLIFTFHFKSKFGGKNDPAGLMWEGHRMEMAQALRLIAQQAYKKHSANKPLLFMLGDRNNAPDSATGKILAGTLNLKDFQDRPGCRAFADAEPLCPPGSEQRGDFESVFSAKDLVEFEGTHTYHKKQSWLDDILVLPGEELKSWRVKAGLVKSPRNASDHALVYVSLESR